MKKPDPINKVKHQDEFSSGLMEQFGKWMDGDPFQNTEPVDLNLVEAPFDGMDPQSNGAEIEDTTKKKKSAKKESPEKQLDIAGATKEETEVLEREEYEIDGETYVIEKAKGLDGKACWKGYKLAGTKQKGGKTVDNCVKAEHHQKDQDGNTVPHKLEEKTLDKVDKSELKGKHKDRKDKDIDNDGDVDGSDKYLHMRRKKVSKIISMKGKK